MKKLNVLYCMARPELVSRRWLAWTVLLGWALLSLLALAWSEQRFYGVFDPASQLQQLPLQQPGAAVLMMVAGERGIGSSASNRSLSGGVVVNHHSAAGSSEATADELWLVTAPDCYCASAARRHLNSLQQALPQLRVRQLSTTQWQQLGGTALPATPAVLWYRQQQLQYAGPLAQGPWCGDAGDLLLPLLKGEQQLAGVWLNSETAACRCPAAEVKTASS